MIKSDSMTRALKLLAPYLAVGVFWCMLDNAWLAILAYHVQILLWSRGKFEDLRRPILRSVWLFLLLSALAGPLLYILMPVVTRVELSSWLATHDLSRTSLAMMVPYYGLVHPLLEQIHWNGLREDGPIAHPLFAGYHLLVLHSLLAVPWLIVCFIILTASSITWRHMRSRANGLSAPIASHLLADLGIVVAAWLRAAP